MFYALDMNTGRPTWSYDIRRDGNQKSFHGRMLFSDSLVYIGTDIPMGHVYAFEKHGGRMRWKHFAGLGVHGDIAGSDHRVYALTKEDTLLCLEPETGAVIWMFDTKAGGGLLNDSSPCVAGCRVYFRGMTPCVYSLDAASGRLIWQRELPDQALTSVNVWHGGVYVGSKNKMMYRLETETGAIVAALPLEETPYGAIVDAGNRLLFFTGRRGAGSTLLAAGEDLSTILWSVPAPANTSWTTYRPHVWDDDVVVGDSAGTVAAFRITGGDRRWTITVKGTVKTIARSKERLFIGTQQGMLYSFAIKNGT